MSLRKILWIFRHGETDWNAEGRFQGHIDIPLNEKGRKQARELMERLKAQSLQAVLSSDLSRARETGQIIANGIGVPLYSDPDLRESHLGEAQGLTYTEIQNRFGEEILGRWRSDLPTDADVSYPGGESGAQVIFRVFGAFERFFQAYPDLGVLGISCHGGVIRRVMQHLRPSGSGPVRIPNAVLYRIEFDPLARKWHLPTQNGFLPL